MKVKLPRQYIIYVEQHKAIPEKELVMDIEGQEGETMVYRVPVMRYWEETAATLEAKHLEPLLPLQVFKIRKSLDAIARSKKSEKEKAKPKARLKIKKKPPMKCSKTAKKLKKSANTLSYPTWI